MKLNQNAILLDPHNGFYEEYVLASTETATILPGTFLVMNGTEDVQGNEETAVVQSTVPEDYEIDSVETFVVLENALLSKSINHKAFPGEITPLYRPVSGDRVLVRAVTGAYVDGDPLYFVQTANGIYVTKDNSAAGAGEEIKAYACENFTIPAETNMAAKPPIYIDAVDDSTIERPSTVRLNGAVVNLLRVRFA